MAQKVEYNDGYNLIYYEDGSKEIINGAMNFIRWDGVWRPTDELNISNGSWPYLYSENATDANFKVDDTTLSIPKANTKFKTRFDSISYNLIYSKSELEGKEQYINLTSVFLDFPYDLKSGKTRNEYRDEHNIKHGRFRFRAGMEHIIIHDDTLRDYVEDGKIVQDVTYLSKKDYDFRIVNGQIRLVFEKQALDKLNGNVIIEIRTWDVVGANNLLWGGNVTLSSTREVKATGNVELRQKVDDYALYTTFDEGSGRRIHNENTGTVPLGNLEGALTSSTYTNGKYGKAIYFNGMDNKVLFNDNAAFRLPYDFTIAYYLKLASGVDNSDTDIIRKGSTATADPDSWYKVELTNNIMHGSVTKNGASVDSKDTTDRRDNLWHFVAYARQSTTCSLVVDGTTVRTTSGCPTNAVNSALLSIGSKDTYTQTTGLDFTRGTIDEVRIFNRKLSSAELTSIRNNEHYSVGTITRNLNSVIGTGEEIKESGCNGTWDRTITKVDVLASTNNINWDMIQSNAYPDVVYPVSTGNNYKYSRCSLSTTDTSRTPVIKSIRARIGPKASVLAAEAGGPYNGTAVVLISFTGIASGGTPPYTYNWSFGDGDASGLANPTHAYTNTGSYTAQLTVTDNNGTSVIDSASVTINPESMFSISNIAAASGKNYTKDTLAVGKLFYIDRTYTFTSVPSAYTGLDYIRTATTDRYSTFANFLQFDVNTDVTVYVAYDDRIYPKASWLSSFTDTGNNLARSDGVSFSIYSKSFPAGHISIGSCSIFSTGAGGMYVVIVKTTGTPAPSTLGVSISESPDPVLSDGTSQVTVHVTSGGSNVVGANVNLSVTGGSLSRSTGTTDTSGDFTATYTAPSVSAQAIYTISATASKTGFIAVSRSDMITVNPTPVLNYIAVSPSSITKLTVGQTRTFNAAAKDQNGNPMSGINISWTNSNLTVGNMVPLFSITGPDGNASAAFNALEAGNTIIMAQNGSINDSASINVNLPIPPTLNVTVSESSDPIFSNGSSVVTVHVTADGLPVEGAAVDASATSGSLVLSLGLTDASGNFMATYTAPSVSAQAIYTISATASKTGFIAGSGSDQITVNPVSSTFTISNIVAASGKTYTKDKLAVGKLFYIDRTYTFTGVPSTYNGLDYIKTATTDRYSTVSNFLQFDVNTDVTVYVAYDDRIYPKASWLSSFTDTGNNLARSDSVSFSIYSKSFPAGHISIGGCSISATGAGGMYVIIVKPTGTP